MGNGTSPRGRSVLQTEQSEESLNIRHGDAAFRVGQLGFGFALVHYFLTLLPALCFWNGAHTCHGKHPGVQRTICGSHFFPSAVLCSPWMEIRWLCLAASSITILPGKKGKSCKFSDYFLIRMT